MATFWDLITTNSSLPVQEGNTFWDHLQNQVVSAPRAVVARTTLPPVIYGETLVLVEEAIRVVYDDDNLNVSMLDTNVILDNEELVDITNDL